MSRDHVRRGTHDRQARRRARPGLEGLEDRLLLYSTTGGSWVNPQRITFSFVPDGTSVGGTPSSLFATLNAVAPTATWEAAFLKAAAIWEQVANVNLVQVSDSGATIGGVYYQQGDPNDGDIRIGAIPENMNTLAFAFLPPPFNGGSAAGDIFFNSNQSFQINGNYDILTVALHEFGHALGMSHSAMSSADMYAYYTGVKQSLSSDDTAGVQSIYDGRKADGYGGPAGNFTTSTATDITPYINPSSSQIALYYLDMLGTENSEWFKVTVPSSTTGKMAVTMQSTGLSELSPRIQVYNSSLVSLNYATAPNTYGATVTVSIPGVSAGQVYYIRASAASSGPTSAGNFGLLVNLGPNPQYPIGPPNTYVANQPDQGGGVFPELVIKGEVNQGIGNGHGNQGNGNGHASQVNGDGNANQGNGNGSGNTSNDGAGDLGVPMQIGSLIGIGDALTIGPIGPASPASPGDGIGPGHSNAGPAAVDPALLIAPAADVQARDAALNSLVGEQHGRGQAGARVAWLPSILSLA